MKKSCIITIVLTIISFVLVYVFSITIPYSIYEKIFAYLGVLSLLTGFILLIIVASRKKFLDWILLILGWIGLILLFLTLGQGGDAPFLYVLPILLVPYILFIISIILFIREIRKDHFRIDYLGIILSVLPFFITGIMILINL